MEIWLRSLVNGALHVSFWILHDSVRWTMCQISKPHKLSTNKTGAMNYCNYIHLLLSFVTHPFCMNTSITWHSLVSFLITQNITCDNIMSLIMYIGTRQTFEIETQDMLTHEKVKAPPLMVWRDLERSFELD